ncbi:MAG: RluA family pseudouridine synthase [Candidatus Methylacidiphilales bacterium]
MPQVVREHPDWLVVDKPAPLLIHPTRPDGEFTLWHSLQESYPDEQLCLLNRLDRETSGLVLVGRHPAASSCLGKMAMERVIEKRYLAIVHGVTEPDGEIAARIGRRASFEPADIYVEQIIHPDGKPALTRFCRLETRAILDHPFSLLSVELMTGRMHQIRVHFQSIGHPVVGDKLYGPDRRYYLKVVESGWEESMRSDLLLRRQALHACRLAFTYQGEDVCVESPLPEELVSFWDGMNPL